MSKKFLWCSTHTPTKEQMTELKSMGSVEFLKDVFPSLQERLNNCPADRQRLYQLANDLHDVTRDEDYILVQPGGSPAFQFILGKELPKYREVLYAHSQRVSEDVPQADGTIKKVSTFKHLGFI